MQNRQNPYQENNNISNINNNDNNINNKTENEEIKQKKKSLSEILKEILEKNIYHKLNSLEKSYQKHSANLDYCFNSIEYIKSKLIIKIGKKLRKFVTRN